MSALLVEAKGVVRRFGALVAVDHADLSVSPGEIVGLLGANGAGKTTLIRMLLGLLPVDEGSVLLFGRRPSRAVRRRLGYVPQGLGLWDDLTAAENMAFTARAFGLRSATSSPAGSSAAASPSGSSSSASSRPGASAVGSPAGSPPATSSPAGSSPAGGPLAGDEELRAAAGRLVRTLPLGLRRRLAFAAALSHDPELLVLDEPTSGVDPLARARLWDTVHGAVDAGRGALVTTHYMDETEQCDRVVVMTQGRVVADGRPADISAGRRAVRVRTDDWPAAFAALDEAGEPVALVGRELRVPGGDAARVQTLLSARRIAARTSEVPATFEEVFVELTRAGGGAPQPREATA